MNRKLKLALAALLGFSAACSSVKNVPRESSGTKQESGDVPSNPEGGRRIIAMYGVRTPEGMQKVEPLKADSLRGKPVKSQFSELDPVAEIPQD